MHNEVNPDASAASTPGRTLSAELTDRILNETWVSFQQRGYSSVDIESVAREVGCGKTSIYRRWATKQELLAAAFMHNSEFGEDPDSGNLLDDLMAFIMVNVRNQQGRPFHVILRIDEPEIRDTLWEKFYVPRQELGFAILRRGIERGELDARANLADIIDLVSGLVLFRNAIRHSITTEEELRRILPGILANPPLEG